MYSRREDGGGDAPEPIPRQQNAALNIVPQISGLSLATREQKLRILEGPSREYLAKICECPVCYDVVVPPINACLNGHNLCFHCRCKCKICPVCRSEFSMQRNLFAESVVARCVIECKFAESGCTRAHYGDHILEHESLCDLRNIRCPDCAESIEYHKFIQHLKDANIPSHEGPECNTGYEMPSSSTVRNLGGEGRKVWEPTWIQAFDYHFFGLLESDNDSWWFSVACFGSEEEASLFTCEISLYNSEKQVNLKYSGPVHSIRIRNIDACKLGHCLAVAKSVVDTYVNCGGVDVEIKIRQKTFGFSENVGPDPPASRRHSINLDTSESYEHDDSMVYPPTLADMAALRLQRQESHPGTSLQNGQVPSEESEIVTNLEEFRPGDYEFVASPGTGVLRLCPIRSTSSAIPNSMPPPNSAYSDSSSIGHFSSGISSPSEISFSSLDEDERPPTPDQGINF